MISRSVAIEAAIVLAVMASGFAVGSFVGTHFTGQPLFYQAEFGPAVMAAAGHGFVNPAPAAGSPLAEFLALHRKTLTASDTNGLAQLPLDQFQQAHRYLMLLVAGVWKATGISWDAVPVAGGFLCALMLAGCYAVIRVWLGKAAAVIGALFTAVSPLHLGQLPHIRDYSKGPFILLAVALTSFVVTRQLSRRSLLLLSAACGAVVGIGLGFKMDVTIMAPIFLASLWLFVGSRPWKDAAGKCMASVAFVAALLVAGAPIIFRLSSGGSNGFHAILLGYADQFDDALGVSRAPYSVLPFYDDGYVEAMTIGYSARRTGRVPVVPSAGYDAAGRAYLIEIARHFPADVLTRVYASAGAILNSIFDSPALNFLREPATRLNPVWDVLTNQLPHRARVSAVFEGLSVLNGWGVLLGVVIVGAAAMESMRLGAFAVWMTLALTGYASLQFADRHFFHLQIIPLVGLLVIGEAVIARRAPTRPALRRAALTLGAVAMVLLLPMFLLRTYQDAHLHAMFGGYLDAPRTRMDVQHTDEADTTVLRWPGMEGRAIDAHWRSDYYVVEYDGRRGDVPAVQLRYRSVSRDTDFTRVTSAPVDAGLNRIVFPVYAWSPLWQFDGLEMPAGLGSAVRGIYRIDHPERLPLLIDLRLGPSWTSRPLHQRFGEAYGDGEVRILGSGSSALAWLSRVNSGDAVPRPESVATAYSPSIHVTPAAIVMDGMADSQSSYLAEFTPVTVTAAGASALVVRGRVVSGGIGLGLLDRGNWHSELIVDEPGEFIAIVPVRAPGTYTPIITNATRRDHDRNRFELSRFGMVSLAH